MDATYVFCLETEEGSDRMKINVSFLAALFLVGTDLVAVTAGLRGKKLALVTMFGFCVVLGYFLWEDTIFPTRHGGRFE
jgi:hypothetical protein